MALDELRPTTRAKQDRIEHLLRPDGAAGAVDAAGGTPPPLADIHIDLPAEDEAEDDLTLVELPLDDGEDEGGDTQRMPL
jgi:hypothetical protein